MKILALELSSGQGSIAWRNGSEVPFQSEFPNDRKHSGYFFENLQRCVQEFGHPDRIVVGLGPGSYAGTRIAIATAIGLQSVTGAELIGLPSFCALPAAVTQYVVIGDARRQTFWLAQVDQRRCVEGPMLCSEAEMRARLDAAEAPVFSSELVAAFPSAIRIHPSAHLLAEIASAASAEMTRAPLEPIYLREPHITRPKAA